MQEQALSYQLRQMVLVNVGTNMHVPSARITAIDPRGGAAVLGDNGVGKTTTLRILPLFFGHLPSQIVSTGQGQEPMVRFVLPTDASAIAFEYQRGSDREEDLRLVVIRRRGDEPDVPVYRMYRCGFRKELFVDENRFLSDDETQARASDLGIQTTRRLSTSEYRSVILRTPAASKDREQLRRYAVEWSFGPKQLDNLDRLVAAMVKKHINFGDIVQVAVGLVQQDLGQGSERAKLMFKQGRAPIERWLRNREACVDAAKLAGSIDELEYALKDHRAAETTLRARRADVGALSAARQNEKTAVTAAIEALTRARTAQVEADAVARAALEQAARVAGEKAGQSKREYEEQASLAAYFEEQRAAHWEIQIHDLPTLRLQRKQMDEQVAAAETANHQAEARYAALEQEARTTTGARRLELEQAKQPHRDRLATALEQIARAEEAARLEATEMLAQRRAHLQDSLEPLIGEHGTWKARHATPAASEEALLAADQATERLQAHTEQRAQVAETRSGQLAAQLAARQAFADQEAAIRAARGEVDRCAGALEDARRELAPQAGTLRAALRAHPSDGWKRTVAKVVQPSVLDRNDLNPRHLDDAVEVLYGWELDTGVIAAPDWVDDELAKRAIEAAQARLESAQQHLNGLQEGLALKSRQLKEADFALNVAQSSLDVLDGQTATLKAAVDTARQRVDKERRDAQSLAATELSRLQTEIEGLRQQQRQIQTEHQQELIKIKAAHECLRSEARSQCGAAIAAVDAQIGQLEESLRSTVNSLAAQLAEHLTSAGVDVTHLNELRTRAKELRQAIDEREEKQAMVARWRTWSEAGGSARVESLKSAAEVAAAESRRRTQELAESDSRDESAKRAYEAALTAKTTRSGEIDDDIKALAEMDEEFGDYQAIGLSVIDPATSVRELRGQVRAARTALNRLEEAIRTRSGTIRQKLTARENAVRELIEASLQRVADAGEIARASELCTCYKLIGPQVVNDVNLFLRTLLANISAFQAAIRSFEKEVAAFNKRLQKGLSEVRCFERIQDLRLDIITNFETLGFYKELARMDDIVRQHASEVGKDFTKELPPDATARALEHFAMVLGADGSLEVNLSAYITLKGSVTDNGQRKEFKRASELENISSEGLTSLVLITLMTALLNTVRGSEPVHVPWVTDEVGKYDPKNFVALMRMLQDNHIDVVTASPELGSTQQAMFAHHYLFEDRGRIRQYVPAAARRGIVVQESAAQEVLP